MIYTISPTINAIRIDINEPKFVNKLADFLDGKADYFSTQTVVYRCEKQAFVILGKRTPVRDIDFESVKIELTGYVEEFIKEYKIIK